MKPSIIVHGGAGSGKFPTTDRRFKELGNALEAGRGAMSKGSSLDGVVEAVAYMEECGAFNAGRGACLTAAGTMQLDAAAMTAEGRKGAGVALVDCTYDAVRLARWVMENTQHVLVAGKTCKTYARAAGLKTGPLSPSEATLEKFRLLKSDPKKTNPRLWSHLNNGNTVGAVAIDSDGAPAAAVSTGGIWLKLPGRIGDSAVLGAGIYADVRTGAACATGMGEEIIRNALSLKACEYMAGMGAPSAAKQAISLITKASGKGTAGIITVDLKGRIGYSYNTEAMGRAWYDGFRGRVVVQV